MSLQIYNSQNQRKEEFTPLHPGEVRMYVCGPTVYDYLHVGNYRGAIFFNLVRNWLEYRGYKVSFIYNYTDVDDKIIARAHKEGVPAEQIAETYVKEFEKDFSALKLTRHSKNPRVTEFMAQIIELIEELIQKGRAYDVDGDVYYDVHAFADYGKLSHKKLEDLESGFRIEVDSRKKHPADFALWKKAKPGEPSWPSPWSEGRPGWHIECSAMSRALLGDTIDIHGGGMDLLFPHHENELAQSEGATGKPFVRYWMHNNMLQFGSQKMSKSLGNVRTGRSFMDEFGPEVFKYLMLSAHYRSILDFSEEGTHHAVSGLARIYSALAWAEKIAAAHADGKMPAKFQDALNQMRSGVETALDDDFNTPEALARVFELVRQFNNVARSPGAPTPEKSAVARGFLEAIHWLGAQMALFQEPAQSFLISLDDLLLKQMKLNRSEIDQLVVERGLARKNKDFQRADELRTQLTQMGISVQDTKEGSEWEVAK